MISTVQLISEPTISINVHSNAILSEGPVGASAYEIAVSNGYAGTAAEWVTTLQGIDHTAHTSGDGSPGTVDEYTLYEDVAETVSKGTFSVYNGQDGSGGGVNRPFDTLALELSQTEIVLQEGHLGEIVITNYDEHFVVMSSNDDILTIVGDKIKVKAPYTDLAPVESFNITVSLYYKYEGVLHVYADTDIILNVLNVDNMLEVVDSNLHTSYIGSQLIVPATMAISSFAELINMEEIS